MLISWSPCLTRNWLFNEHRMHVMRVCVDAIWFWMTLSLFWTFFMDNLISFSNFNESKNSSLYPDTLLLFTLLSKKYFFIFVMQAKIEYKRHKKRRAEKNGICNFCIWQVWMPCATILADEFFFCWIFEYMYSSAVHSVIVRWDEF